MARGGSGTHQRLVRCRPRDRAPPLGFQTEGDVMCDTGPSRSTVEPRTDSSAAAAIGNRFGKRSIRCLPSAALGA